MRERKETILESIISFCGREYREARIMTNSATITMFMFMSLFPMLMLIMSLLPLLPVAFEDVLQIAQSVLPLEIYPLAEQIITDIYQKSLSGSGLSVTAILTLWAASSGVSWMVRGMHDVYRKEDKRGWFLHRFISLFYTIIVIIVILMALICFVFGQELQQVFVEKFPQFVFWGNLLQVRNIVAIAVISVLLTILYRVFPRNTGSIVRQLPGALIASAGWYGFSNMYSFYLNTITNYSYTYGSLAAIVSLMVWLFVIIQIVLIGGEINYLIHLFIRK